MAADVTVIGAGLAGLSCARELIARGMHVEVLEASDRVGGRVATDEYRGFLLDRGFQVLLTAYPECKLLLNYEALKLKNFYPGSLVWSEGRFHKLSDPWRKPLGALSSLHSRIGSFADKMRVGLLRDSVMKATLPEIFSRPETTTLKALKNRHFSEDMVSKFFRPFFAGIFLEHELATSSRMFEFVFKMFSEGETALPAEGMQAIPRQLAWGIPVQLEHRVGDLREIESKIVVIATEGPEAARLAGTEPSKHWRGVQCFYFAAEKPPITESILMLNGEKTGPINNLSVVSGIAPTYAPPGASLVSASVIGTATEADVREHLAKWFGSEVKRWLHLRTYDIAYAQPDQSSPAFAAPRPPARIRNGLYVCGDHTENASLNGALQSGRRVSEVVMQDLLLT